MSTLTGYQSYKLRAYALLYLPGERQAELELTSFQLTFALNSIPQASLTLALGRNTYTGLAAEIHRLVDDLTVTLPVEVYLQVSQGSNSLGGQFEDWPLGFFRVFTGLLTSTGFARSREQVGFNMGLTHWLSDLNFSSALTRQAHTLTPQQLSGAAAFRMGQGVQPAFSASSLAAKFFTPANVQLDMWGRALGPWLAELSKQDVLADPNDPDGGPGSNVEALNALGRFEPFAYADEQDPQGSYKFGTELSLPIVGLPGSEAIASAIGEDVALETFESFSGTTLWDKLVGGFAANYRFAVVPLVDTALCVPFAPGMRNPWQIIYGEEYNSINISANMPRPVKGVKLFTGFGGMTGAIGFQQGEAGQEPGAGGSYTNPDFKDGQTIYANAPRWSANVVAAPVFGKDAAAPFLVRGNAFFPQVGAPPAAADPALVRAGARTMWDVYARHVYITEALRNRVGSLQGKLRFDVAPGSTVQIQCVQDKFVRSQIGEPAASVLFGEVQAVTISVDAESAQASTAFQVANVRNSAENQIDATSIPAHPFYRNAWSGACLVENELLRPAPNLLFKA